MLSGKAGRAGKQLLEYLEHYERINSFSLYNAMLRREAYVPWGTRLA